MGTARRGVCVMATTNAAKISEHECRAMQELAQGSYGTSELAFVFETGADTVKRHLDNECSHGGEQNLGPRYTDEELLRAYRLVYYGQPYICMSPDVYEEERPDHYPHRTTIIKRFGSWQAARERVQDKLGE